LAYASLGPAWCFTINGISYLAVIIALALMRFKPFVRPARTQSTWSDVREGLSYVRHHKTIRLLIGILGVTSLFGMSYVTLIPAWAVEVLNGDAATNGWLQSVRGIGALVASLMIASLGTSAKRGRLLTIGSFLFPSLVIVFSFIRSVPLALLVLLGVGWAFMIFINLANSLVQHIVPDNLRGRVMSIYALIFLGLMPIGAMLGGLLAEAYGTPFAALVSASVALVFAAILYLGAPFIRKLQ
jgi:predicted MFS family arabinose efflux permease